MAQRRNGTAAQELNCFGSIASPFEGMSRVAFFDRRSFSRVGSEARGKGM